MPLIQLKTRPKKVVATMRKRARQEVETVPATHMDALVLQGVAIDEDSEAVAAHLPTLSSVKSALYRSHKTKFPPLPQTRQDVNLVTDNNWSFLSCETPRRYHLFN